VTAEAVDGCNDPDAPTLRGRHGESGDDLSATEGLHSVDPLADSFRPGGQKSAGRPGADQLVGTGRALDRVSGEFSGDPLITPVDWQRRLSAAVAANAARRAARQEERAELKRRRDRGKAILHVAKLARLGTGDDPTVVQRTTVEAGERTSDARSTAMDVGQAGGSPVAAPDTPVYASHISSHNSRSTKA
jgi:hypothetical protein